jgi:vacuolar-type H+-ATPase subunit C/Vma6
LTANEAELKEESWQDGYRKLHSFAYKYYYSKVILLNNVENGHVGTLLMLCEASSSNLTAIEAELKEESWLDGYGKLHCYAYKYYYSKVILLNNVENGHVGTLLML